jgi:hypothetical protein
MWIWAALRSCWHRAEAFAVGSKAVVALSCGSEMVPSLVKAQAKLNQVKIGPA